MIPADLNPQACLFLKSVTVAIGLRPAFSAKVDGMTSNDSANALNKVRLEIIGLIPPPVIGFLPEAICFNTRQSLSILS